MARPRKVTNEEQKMLKRIDFLRNMVKQLDSDLKFGFITQNEWNDGMEKIDTEVRDMEARTLAKKGFLYENDA